MTVKDIESLRALAGALPIPTREMHTLCDLAAEALRMREPFRIMAEAVRAYERYYATVEVDAQSALDAAYQAHLKAEVALSMHGGGQ